MSIDELRNEIDLLLENAVGPANSASLHVWVTTRAHRFSFDGARWALSYSMEIQHGSRDTFRVDRHSPEEVLDEFRRLILPRVTRWFADNVVAGYDPVFLGA